MWSRSRSLMRYPGSKARFAKFIARALRLNGLRDGLFVEPFCGGASVSIALMEQGFVSEIALNDADPAIAAFWDTVFSPTQAKWLAEQVLTVPLTLIPQIVLGGVLVAIPDMNAGTKLVSLAASSRWATRACEVSMLGGKTINIELMQDAHLRPLWNLYPSDPLNTAEGRVEFLKSHNDKPVEKDRLYWESIAVMTVFLIALALTTTIVLRMQDTL